MTDEKRDEQDILSAAARPGETSLLTPESQPEDATPPLPAITRRLSAEIVGDDAIEADMLETILRLGEPHRSKLARDSALVSLAIRALGRALEDCRREQGKKFPSTADLDAFLAR